MKRKESQEQFVQGTKPTFSFSKANLVYGLGINPRGLFCWSPTSLNTAAWSTILARNSTAHTYIPLSTSLSFPSSFTTFVQLCFEKQEGALGREAAMASEKQRTIAVAMDYSPSSKAATKWAVQNLVKAGDRIILIHVIPKGAGASHKGLWKSSGSPLIPLLEFMETNVQAGYGVSPDKEVLEILQAESKSKQVEVLAKIYWGDAREKLCEAVDDLKVDNVVLGCRGLGPLKRALLGSVSNYVVNNASCPVTVVRGPTGSTA